MIREIQRDEIVPPFGIFKQEGKLLISLCIPLLYKGMVYAPYQLHTADRAPYMRGWKWLQCCLWGFSFRSFPVVRRGDLVMVARIGG